MTNDTKIGILFSGGGSNMQALAKHIAQSHVPAELVLAISNRPDAGGIDFCQKNNIPCAVLDHTNYDTRAAFDAALDERLREAGVDFICAAGFMRLLTPAFVAAWSERIINIHPSLLPKFKGLHTHQNALDAGETEHGCSVHYMSAQMDSGELIVQKRVKIQPKENADSLAKRVLAQEHKAYPEALDMVLAQMHLKSTMRTKTVRRNAFGRNSTSQQALHQ